MKIGPVHLVRDTTFRRLMAERDQAVSELSSKLGLLPGFMHMPFNATAADSVILEPDPPNEQSRLAVERAVRGYAKARADFVAPARSLWDDITERHGPFLQALAAGDITTIQDALARMFQSDIIWGLGFVDAQHPSMLRDGRRSYLLSLFTDFLVSFAEACGAQRLTCIEQQGTGPHLSALNVDIPALLAAAEVTSGLDLSFPQMGAVWGCLVSGRLITLDSLLHSYTVHRLKQLGATSRSTILEIGGGYGCLALLCHRAGLENYTVVDLPWVNVLQGYFLAITIPASAVRIYGETTGTVAILPHWAMETIPDRSVDYVINTNSLPEMGAETARAYIAEIARITRGAFLSINQEAKAPNLDVGRQNCVAELVEAHGGLRRIARQRYWMRQGYVEEVFVPAAAGLASLRG